MLSSGHEHQAQARYLHSLAPNFGLSLVGHKRRPQLDIYLPVMHSKGFTFSAAAAQTPSLKQALVISDE